MSKAAFKPLPLPKAPQAIRDDKNLLKMWESVNGWYITNIHTTDSIKQKNALRTYACHMIVACQVIDERLRPKLKEKQMSRTTLLAAGAVRKAFDWLKEQGVVKNELSWGNGTKPYDAALSKGLHLYKLVTRAQGMPSLNLRKFAVDLEHLRDCERIFHILVMYLEHKKGTVGRSDIVSKGKYLSKLVSRRETREMETLPSSSPVDAPMKGMDIGDDASSEVEQPATKKPRIDKATADSAKVVEPVSDPQPGGHLLELIDDRIIQTNAVGIVAPPNQVSLKDTLDLVNGGLISDRVMNAYLALLCHHANGHWDIARQDRMQEHAGSPRWHAWDTYTTEVLRRRSGMDRAWPPDFYRAAKVEDVEVHLFPWHITGGVGHWCLGVLRRMQGRWQLDQYSTLRGYEKDMQKEWMEMARYLPGPSRGAISSTSVLVRNHVPFVQEGVDCRPLALCIALWMLEGKDLSSIPTASARTKQLRRRIARDLHRWHLYEDNA